LIAAGWRVQLACDPVAGVLALPAAATVILTKVRIHSRLRFRFERGVYGFRNEFGMTPRVRCGRLAVSR
jgi:hypothetical protein